MPRERSERYSKRKIKLYSRFIRRILTEAGWLTRVEALVLYVLAIVIGVGSA